MDEGRLPSGKYTWRIDGFSKITTSTRRSEAFTVGGCNWKIVVYPKGDRTDRHVSIYLEVADAATLPDGWCRDVRIRFALVDQYNGADPMAMCGRSTFRETVKSWGFSEFVPLTELHDHGNGYAVNDTVVVEVEITLYEIVPPVELATQRSILESYFSTFSENFTATGILPLAKGLTSGKQITELVFETPSSDDIEKAKQSLKECLSDLFKLNMRDRLSSAFSILSHTQAGLSPGQQTAIETFKANFDDFVYDFLTFEQDNSNFELQKFTTDHIYSTMMENHEKHLSYKQSSDDHTKEKEDLNKKLEELSLREAKLISDWETLMNESKDVKLSYVVQEKKLAGLRRRRK